MKKNKNFKNEFFGLLGRFYLSTLSELDSNQAEFFQWFSGFSDAESSFSIVPKQDKKGTINRFSFMFAIGLHIDDLDALTCIQTNLNIGRVIVTKDECKFLVTDEEGIKKLISIFDKFTLNTSKYLDYLDFKKAFTLYYGREGFLTEGLKNQILKLKDGMNTMRDNFNMPTDHEIIVTKGWLLGLIEGEGSFQLWRNDLIPVFGLVLTERQFGVLEKIKEYLSNNLGFDAYSMYKLNSSSAIAINHQKARNNSKGSVLLLIKNIHVLHNYFIPFFEDLKFMTKKYKDFLDFKIICKAVYWGAHKRSEVRSLILKLSLTMNNFRLSTNSGSLELLSKSERDTLVNASPTVEHLSDGRQRDIDSRKIVHQHTSCIYEIIKSDSEVIIKQTLLEAAKTVGVDSRTLSKHLDVEVENSVAEVKGYRIKRIAVFYKK